MAEAERDQLSANRPKETGAEGGPPDPTGESELPSGPQAIAAPAAAPSNGHQLDARVTYRQYVGEEDLPHVMRLIDSELSEPYSIFTYRYFLHQWPSLCLFACDPGSGRPVATIVAKVEIHKSTGAMRGYIAMLVVETPYRGAGIGTQLVTRAINAMKAKGAEEIVLEAETTNRGALAMYEALGFIRDKRLERYYLSGTDAFRLKLLLPLTPQQAAAHEARRLKALRLDEMPEY